ncbi:MAG: hypothetical protein JSU00_31220 [Acidobacteria bacterium]|nr:hypothetical protein [Acidobacteriota bacterium]
MTTPSAALAVAAAFAACLSAAEPVPVSPSRLAKVGQVDARYQSYNVEMVEVTGGRFWAPYRTGSDAPKTPSAPGAVPGIDPSLFRMRPPIDLSQPRLRKLAAALGPSYVRISGTWANSTYFHDSDTPPPSAPPAGFGGVLTRAQWRGVVEFAKAVDAKIVTSFAISPGVRDANGVWTPDQASKLLAYTKTLDASIAAAEFFNEPSFAAMGGAPKGYDAAAYGRDFAVFRTFIRKASPNTVLLGPGAVGEGGALAGGASALAMIKSEDMLRATGHGVDAFSYHFYGAVSKRCGAFGAGSGTTPEAALSEQWLDRTDREAAFYQALRDRFEPGRSMWLTETGETACGGDPWAATFADSFRYLDQLGRLAKRGVQVVAHNTLAASDYALIEEETLAPRPNYWSALLWRRLMGDVVLDAGPTQDPKLHLYAHCMANHPGGVTLLAIVTDTGAPRTLSLPAAAAQYTLTSSKGLESPTVELNGAPLAIGADDSLPAIEGRRHTKGRMELPPASITFLVFPDASNGSCR